MFRSYYIEEDYSVEVLSLSANIFDGFSRLYVKSYRLTLVIQVYFGRASLTNRNTSLSSDHS